ARSGPRPVRRAVHRPGDRRRGPHAVEIQRRRGAAGFHRRTRAHACLRHRLWPGRLRGLGVHRATRPQALRAGGRWPRPGPGAAACAAGPRRGGGVRPGQGPQLGLAVGRGARVELWLDSTRARVDTGCGRRSDALSELDWEVTCLQGYTPAGPGLVEIEPESFAGGHGQVLPRLQVAGFDRRRFHLEEGVQGQLLDATVGVVLRGMGYPGSGPGRYWFGDAHVQLQVGGETLQFKAFVPKVEGDYEFFRTMRWWEPSRVLPGASPWFGVHMRGYMESPGELELLEHYREGIGLY